MQSLNLQPHKDMLDQRFLYFSTIRSAMCVKHLTFTHFELLPCLRRGFVILEEICRIPNIKIIVEFSFSRLVRYICFLLCFDFRLFVFISIGSGVLVICWILIRGKLWRILSSLLCRVSICSWIVPLIAH